MPRPPAVTAIPLPPGSLLAALHRPGDFLDCYACPSSLPPREAARIAALLPGWAAVLLRLRNALVAPFGLVGARPDTGDFGPFPLVAETPRELVLGFDDRHLDFRLSVMAAAGQVSLATWVRTHNAGGRAYLALVMPFHRLIVRNAVARVGRAHT